MLKNNENYSKKTMNLICRHKSQTPTLGKISKIDKKEYCKFLRFGALVFCSHPGPVYAGQPYPFLPWFPWEVSGNLFMKFMTYVKCMICCLTQNIK